MDQFDSKLTRAKKRIIIYLKYKWNYLKMKRNDGCGKEKLWWLLSSNCFEVETKSLLKWSTAAPVTHGDEYGVSFGKISSFFFSLSQYKRQEYM